MSCPFSTTVRSMKLSSPWGTKVDGEEIEGNIIRQNKAEKKRHFVEILMGK